MTAISGAFMFALFQRKRPVQAATAAPATATKTKGLMRPESAASLLATARRQKLLEHIWQRTSLSRQQFAVLYLGPLERYAELVQQFPASESHHHAYPGGLLDHGLEIVAYALKLRQSHLLPAGATPEDQAAQSEAWTAATAYAALLHDIGKIAVDLHVEMSDGRLWHPWHGPLPHPYRFRYRQDREYRLHNAASGLLYNRVLDREILDWLSSYPELWAALLYVLAGQHEHAGVLGELVTKADRASVAQELGGDPAKAMAAPKHTLQRKLLEGLRYLLKEELKLNQPQASDGWLTQDSLWLVSKTCSDKLRAHLLSQGIDSIPSSNAAVFNVLQDHMVLQPTPEGRAIWKATVTSETGWSYSFTLLRLSPALIWEANERPTAFTGTVVPEEPASDTDAVAEPAKATMAESATMSLMKEATAATPYAPPVVPAAVPRHVQPDAMEDILSIISAQESPANAARGVVSAPQRVMHYVQNKVSSAVPPYHPPPTPVQPSATHFLTWLKDGIATRKLIINDAKALVHTVDNTVYLVSPGLFQRYALEHPQIEYWAKQEKVSAWLWIQRRFEKLKLHRKHPDGLNIWACTVSGPRKSRQLHGYVLNDSTLLFTDNPPDNPYLHFKNSS